jgi:hypothetical protein
VKTVAQNQQRGVSYLNRWMGADVYVCTSKHRAGWAFWRDGQAKAQSDGGDVPTPLIQETANNVLTEVTKK